MTKKVLWHHHCPYCHNENVEVVDEDSGSTKYICRDCGEDFLVGRHGEVTTRNNRVIQVGGNIHG